MFVQEVLGFIATKYVQATSANRVEEAHMWDNMYHNIQRGWCRSSKVVGLKHEIACELQKLKYVLKTEYTENKRVLFDSYRKVFDYINSVSKV